MKQPGKTKKVAARKAPRTVERTAKADAPAEAVQEASTRGAPTTFPCSVIVNKGAEKLPVQVTDEAHFNRLAREFGADHIEVQS